MKMLKWKRSDDGFVDSKCGRFQIVPRWWGRVAPQEYILEDKGKQVGSYDTQRAAKNAAERIVNPPEEEDVPIITPDMI